MLILECDWQWQSPGSFRSTLGGRPYRRWWFAWFAVTHWPGDAKEYGDAVRNSQWVS